MNSFVLCMHIILFLGRACLFFNVSLFTMHKFCRIWQQYCVWETLMNYIYQYSSLFAFQHLHDIVNKLMDIGTLTQFKACVYEIAVTGTFLYLYEIFSA